MHHTALTDKENLVAPTSLNTLHLKNHIYGGSSYKISNSTNFKLPKAVTSPTKKPKLNASCNTANPRIETVMIQLLENEEDSFSKQVIKIELKDHNQIAVVCRNIAANMYTTTTHVTRDLVIQMPSAYEEELDNAYRTSILTGIDPNSPTMRPFTRDFYNFAKDLPAHGNAIRANIAKYKRRSCLAKYCLLEPQETSKKQKWECVIAAVQSLTMAQNLENQMYSGTKIHKSPVRAFQLKHNEKVIVDLGGGKKIEIQYDPITNSLAHRMLQTSLDFFLPSAKYFENLLLEVNAKHLTTCTSQNGNRILYKIVCNESPRSTQEIASYKQFLQKQLSRTDIPDKERKMLMDVYSNVNHCDDSNYKQIMRHIVRKHLLGNLCTSVINHPKKLSLQAKIAKAKQHLQSILFMEAEEENEERNEGTLLLSTNFMTSLQKKYITLDGRDNKSRKKI